MVRKLESSRLRRLRQRLSLRQSTRRKSEKELKCRERLIRLERKQKDKGKSFLMLMKWKMTKEQLKRSLKASFKT